MAQHVASPCCGCVAIIGAGSPLYIVHCRELATSYDRNPHSRNVARAVASMWDGVRQHKCKGSVHAARELVSCKRQVRQQGRLGVVWQSGWMLRTLCLCSTQAAVQDSQRRCCTQQVGRAAGCSREDRNSGKKLDGRDWDGTAPVLMPVTGQSTGMLATIGV
jgi:hypothetical protein